jgi:hypothetical protein
MSIKYHQQATPSLTFASPLAKTKLNKWIRATSMFSLLKKYTCVKKILLHIKII